MTAVAADYDPKLVEFLAKAGDRWGPLGVALAAASMSDPDVVVNRLQNGKQDPPPADVVEILPGDEFERAERGVRFLLDAVAADPCDDGIEDTPKRVVKAMREMTAGYDVDVAELLGRTFDKIEYDGMVVLRNVEFVSLCEHHLLPFQGRATVAYIPRAGGPVVGLSKLARLVDAYARRLQVQERMTTQITDALAEHLEGLGSACVLRASHSCMTIRGVRKADAQMVTSSLTGAFKDDARARAEFLALANT